MDSYRFLRQVPVTVNNYYGDPVLQIEDTLDKLRRLSADGHSGPVSIITKGYISLSLAQEIREAAAGLAFVVLVSISELPAAIEPLGQEHRYRTIANLLEAGIPAVGYVRPFMPGYNDNEEAVDRMFSGIRDAGCKIVIVSGFRGDDNILLQTGIEDRTNWVLRVKQLPKGIAAVIDEKGREYGLEVFSRTSCGVTRALGLPRTYNPYWNSPLGAGCDMCPVKETCSHEEPVSGSLDFIRALGYHIEYIPDGNEVCTVTPDNRLSCRSCCTTCFMLKVPHIVAHDSVTLGDLAFIRFITGVLACKPGVVDTGESTIGNVTFPKYTPPFRVQCLNSWFEYARQTSSCFGCRYCIVPVYRLENRDYGCPPKDLADWLDRRMP